MSSLLCARKPINAWGGGGLGLALTNINVRELIILRHNLLDEITT